MYKTHPENYAQVRRFIVVCYFILVDAIRIPWGCFNSTEAYIRSPRYQCNNPTEWLVQNKVKQIGMHILRYILYVTASDWMKSPLIWLYSFDAFHFRIAIKVWERNVTNDMQHSMWLTNEVIRNLVYVPGAPFSNKD